VALGTPEKIAENPASYTGHFLKPLLERNAPPAPAPKKLVKSPRK